VAKTSDNPLIVQIQKRWDSLILVNPQLRPIAEFHQEVCKRIYQSPVHLTELPFQSDKSGDSSALLKEKLKQGIAFLQGEEEVLDFTLPVSLYRELLQMAFSYKRILNPYQSKISSGSFLNRLITGARSMVQADKSQESQRDIRQLFIHVLQGNMDRIAQEAEQLHLSPDLLLTLLHYSLMPILQAYGARLKPLLDLDLWTRGNCPVCGAWPSLSELRGADQIRYLRCSLCGSDWVYPLLRCPYCENADHEKLGYFFVEGEEKKHRIYVCEACKGYLKVFPTLDPTPTEFLNLEDLATLHFDVVAAERGYSRPYPFQKL
jgi:FdhE protein